jgi:uncharacterized protein (DUF1330 family)
MTKGYWIAHVDVTDPSGYAGYRDANGEPLHKYGANFAVRAGAAERVEGSGRSRNVVLEFADYATALACYRSDDYQQAKALRLGAADVDLIAIAGYDGPQPPEPNAQVLASPGGGYWIGHVDVIEPEGYKAYMTADMAPIGAFGGRFLVRGGHFEILEGKVRSRSVLIRFPSYDAALACYHSPQYQAAAALRRGKADFDLTVCAGYDSAQR